MLTAVTAAGGPRRQPVVVLPRDWSYWIMKPKTSEMLSSQVPLVLLKNGLIFAATEVAAVLVIGYDRMYKMRRASNLKPIHGGKLGHKSDGG